MCPFFSALQKSERFEVTVIYERHITRWRKQTGWSDDTAGLNSIFLDGAGWKNTARDIIGSCGSKDCYVFGGIGSYPKLRYATKFALKHEIPCFAATELSRTTKPVVRLLLNLRNKYRYWSFGRYLRGVFTIGSTAKEYYTRLGYSPSRLFDWMYFVAGENLQTFPKKSQIPRIVFVGRMVPLKGVETLLKALSHIDKPFTLDLFGCGPYLEKYKKIAVALSLSGKITWHGLVANRQLVAELPRYDILVLPSQGRGDGWGGVVNEAINAGCAVICSDKCGSKDLVRCGQVGEVFEAARVDSLANVINNLLDRSTLHKYQGNALKYRKYIAPAEAVDYFEKIIQNEDAEHVTAPWMRHS